MTFSDPGFWVALLQIIGVNIVLSGDNAVVIALAARSLPPKQQKQAVLWGSGAAVVMRIVLTFLAVELLKWPYLKLIGAALLLWIGIQLLLPEDEQEEGGSGKANAGMMAAVRTILIADLVMSLDNVIAVAAAAKGSATLLILGLLISIPLVIFGSTILMKFMERWPIIITIGGALLGWVAGEMAISDPSVKGWVDANQAWLHYGGPILGAIIVVAVGKIMAKRAADREEEHPVVDLATPTDQHVPASGAAAAGAARVLLVADETPESLTGVGRFVEQCRTNKETVTVDLLNVQPPVHRDVAIFVAEAEIKSHHHDEGLKALEPARTQLEEAGIPTTVHIGVGDFNHVVVHYAKSLGAKKVFLTQTARNESDSADWMGQHVSVPVTGVA